MSAALMTLATFSVSARICTMPMLAPTDSVLVPHTKRKSRIAWRAPSAMRVACSSVQPSSNTPNSSPPRRAMVSEARTRVCSTPVTSRSSRSPAWCPQVSLTTLNWSRSMYSSAYEPSPRCVQAVVEFAPVDESGERVVTGLPGERAFQASLPGHVVEHHHRADHLALAVADGGCGFLDGHLVTGARDEHRVIGRRAALGAPEHAGEGVLDGLAGELVDELEHRADRLAARFRNTPGGQGLGDRVNVFDAPCGVGADHRIPDRLQGHLRALLLGEHGLFGALALGDVGDRALVAEDATGAIAHRARVLQDHQLLDVAPAHEELRIPNLPFRLDAAGELGAIGGIPVKRRSARQRVQLLGVAVAEHGDECRIDRQQPAAPPALIDALGDTLEQTAELRLTAAQRFLREAPLDRDARELRGARHDLRLRWRRQSRLAAVHPE